MSLWLIIIDIGQTSKVPNYDTHLMLFTPFFSKKFVLSPSNIGCVCGHFLPVLGANTVTTSVKPIKMTYFFKIGHKLF